MDHSGHGGMDHGGHGGGMDDMCSMSMLFTWDTTNLCIVFKQWHIRSTAGLIVSLLAVIALGAGYEALREGCRRYEAAINRRTESAPREFPPCLYPVNISHLSSLSPYTWPAR